jgi:hypothetical protein
MSRSDTIIYDIDSQMVTVSTLPIVNDENQLKNSTQMIARPYFGVENPFYAYFQMNPPAV